ncbi:Zinc finger, RING-type,Zinc finger, RING/FYVE/PHD-type,Zinc finger, RING-type, conserved site, partial [Cinara cedri]
MENASSENSNSHKDKNNKETHNQDEETKTFECNICLDNIEDAVVGICGHLFCWPCLHQWLETEPRHQECPVCKAHISKENVIPIYGCGNTKREDLQNNEPPRSTGNGTELDTHIDMSENHLMEENEIFPLDLLTSLPPT